MLKPGKLRFSCGMGMYTGQLTAATVHLEPSLVGPREVVAAIAAVGYEATAA